jgi:hypothetical protein
VRQTDTIQASLAVDENRHACVIWLDLATQPQRWRVDRIITEHRFPAGSHVTAPVRQTDTILASLAVDENGHACVIWLDLATQPQRWQVDGISKNSFAPGSHITDLVRQTDTILAALTADSSAHANVIWLH